MSKTTKKRVVKPKTKWIHVHLTEIEENGVLSYYVVADPTCSNALQVFDPKRMELIKWGKHKGQPRKTMSYETLQKKLANYRLQGMDVGFKTTKITLLDTSRVVQVGHEFLPAEVDGPNDDGIQLT